jgi:hypothetical protein
LQFLFLLPLIPQTITHATADQILNDAILINGVILGFVLVVLDHSAIEAIKLSKVSSQRNRHIVMVVLDAGILFYTIREIIQEMLALTVVQSDLAALIGNAVFIPIRFGLYVAFRFAAIVLV